MKTRLFALCALALVSLSGCISVKVYVDPSMAKTGYEDLRKPAEPLALKVNVEFLRNGKRVANAENELRGDVERILRATGVIVPSASAENGEISVTVNNVGDLGSAAGKGFATGMTFGLVGTSVQDGYEMSVTLTIHGSSVTKSGYKDVLISTVGNKKAPEGLTPTSPSAGFATVVEQMLLNALSDLQKDGYLASLETLLDRLLISISSANDLSQSPANITSS